MEEMKEKLMKRDIIFFIILALLLSCSFALSYTYIHITSQQVGEGEVYICKLPVTVFIPETNREYSVRILIDPQKVPLWDKNGDTYVTLDENMTRPLYYWRENSTTILVSLPPSNNTTIRTFIWYCALENPYQEYKTKKKFSEVYVLPYSLENATIYLKFK